MVVAACEDVVFDHNQVTSTYGDGILVRDSPDDPNLYARSCLVGDGNTIDDAGQVGGGLIHLPRHGVELMGTRGLHHRVRHGAATLRRGRVRGPLGGLHGRGPAPAAHGVGPTDRRLPLPRVLTGRLRTPPGRGNGGTLSRSRYPERPGRRR